MITAYIEAHDRRYVATIDNPVAYINTDADKHIIILLKEILADIISTDKPTLYRKYNIMNNKGEVILYVKIQKDLHG